MNKLNYFLILLLLFAGCKKTSDSDDSKTPISVSVNLPGAYFTEIEKVGYAKPSPVIMDKLIAMIDATPEKAQIYLSIFGFDHAGVIEALKRASNRGVILHIMIDMSINDTKLQNPATISAIRAFINPGSEVVVVTSDVNDSSINHNKFVLFSELVTQNGTATNVIFQTSHNFTVDDSKKIQDALTLSHTGLYNSYQTYWNDIKAKASSGMRNFNYSEYTNATDGITGFFFPKRKNGSSFGDDTIIEILNDLDPAAATVRVGMSDWVVSRLNVAKKLTELQTQGARVEVVVKNKIDIEIQNELNALKNAGGFVKMYNISRTNIHSKFMIIDGKYKGEQCKLLITGSPNFTTNALRNNNEAMIMLKNNKSLYDAYISYYTQMKLLDGI